MHFDLDSIPFRETRYPGVSIHFYHRDADTGHAAVMIKMEPGSAYPAHRHQGPEELLVLQGAFRDENGEYRAGDFCRFEDGTVHHPCALPREESREACIFFAIAAEGIHLE